MKLSSRERVVGVPVTGWVTKLTSTECRTSSSVAAAVVASGVWAAVSEVIVGPSGAPVAPPSVPIPAPTVVAAPLDTLFSDWVECSAL